MFSETETSAALYGRSMAGHSTDIWDEERVSRWLRQAEGIERQLRPVSEVLFAAASLQRGDAVLDVGCGTGPTTREAATLVGPEGSVTGLDVSGEMLAAAAGVPTGERAATISWLEADPVQWSPPAATYDVVLSRFGVMFFSDPAAAFTHLAAATRDGGRLAMATWAPRPESDLFEVPYTAALTALCRPDELPPDAGPFSLGAPDDIRTLLEPAGWHDVDPVVHHLTFRYGGGVDARTAATASLELGPTRIVTHDLDDDRRSAVLDAITDALQQHVDDAGHVSLRGTVIVTTAVRGAATGRRTP